MSGLLAVDYKKHTAAVCCAVLAIAASGMCLMELYGKAPSMQMVETRKFGNFSLNGSCGKREKTCYTAAGEYNKKKETS